MGGLILIALNLEAVRNALHTNQVTIVAVTKTQPPEVVRAAFAAGLTVMGENRVQEALEKASQVKDLPLEWHLIGHLQTNKVKQAVSLFSLIHSIDSSRLALEINRCAAEIGKIQDVLLQVNVAGEKSKSGIAPEQANELAKLIESLLHIRLCGVMTIAPFYDNPEHARPVFRQTRSIFDTLRRGASSPECFRWLSMGMTHDYGVAVEEGSNMIRIGTGLFGARTAP